MNLHRPSLGGAATCNSHGEIHPTRHLAHPNVGIHANVVGKQSSVETCANFQEWMECSSLEPTCAEELGLLKCTLSCGKEKRDENKCRECVHLTLSLTQVPKVRSRAPDYSDRCLYPQQHQLFQIINHVKTEQRDEHCFWCFPKMLISSSIKSWICKSGAWLTRNSFNIALQKQL